MRLLSRRLRAHWLARTESGLVVLRRYGDETDGEIAWEDEVVARLAAAGWPTPQLLAGPLRLGEVAWSLHVYLPGRVLSRGPAGPRGYRRLGRLLAEFHDALAGLPPPGQRPGWVSVVDGALPIGGGTARRDELLALLERADSEVARLVRRQLEALEARALPEVFAAAPRQLVHGDPAPWNLKSVGGRCVGLLDFELSHLDVAAADLAFARRGYHDAVVAGYLSQRPIDERHLAQLDALWTAGLFHGLWRMLAKAQARGALDPADLAWHVQQFGKTRRYQ
ncbi:phosphotransferase enzyme family protein [Phenylobacterium terrae]|uniref:phosphotransferase enzyme family protein n=1 Tax=Phenylobacterium terrae TaxID=2665495 RepID=UPI00366ED36C